jgi:aspartate carbamoyltransferase catalytic subunit
MKLQHVLESQQFTRPLINELFSITDRMERILARGGTMDYNQKIMATLFYEPSTRTRFSFEAAMHRLGGRVISTENARDFSSGATGESLEDTISVLNNYTDVIVLRHNEVGGSKRAAKVSRVPIVNAGDGKGGQHPTQALLDLYTVYKERGAIEGLKIAFVGDLANGRTVRSLSYLLGKFERVKLYFVAPPSIQMKNDILDYLEKNDVWYETVGELQPVIPDVDVIYQTRIEKDRLGNAAEDYEKYVKEYYINRDVLQRMPQHSIIMHPLPRLNEISTEADADPRAAYFRQSRNGILVRMALLSMLFDA